MARKKILFVSEAVTLAQVVRLASLASSLDPNDYDVHFAASEFHPLVFSDTTFTRWPIHSLPSEKVHEMVRKGKTLYTAPILKKYIEEELSLFAEARPDLVVGDLRLSLAVSAPRSKIPLVSLANSYWKCERAGRPFPVPEHPVVNLMGLAFTERYFPMVRPKIFLQHARPVNDLRRQFGLSTIGSLEEVLTFGDHTLYADTPMLTAVPVDGERERYLGPVLWSPHVAVPSWWNALPADRATVYVTLGSSGRSDLLPLLLEGMKPLGVNVMAVTANRVSPHLLGNSAYVANFVPGDQAARRSQLVVCNGGSTTAYQALAEGVPVLGIPSNLDQHLSMQGIVAAHAGIGLRSDSLNVDAVTKSVSRLLDDESFKTAARRVADSFKEYEAISRFREFLREVLP